MPAEGWVLGHLSMISNPREVLFLGQESGQEGCTRRDVKEIIRGESHVKQRHDPG